MSFKPTAPNAQSGFQLDFCKFGVERLRAP
jgi:hypothetical protein